jgi:hypothetical protein
MEIILNEKSLHAQFSAYNVKEAVERFLKAIRAVNDSGLKKQILTSANFFSVEMIPGTRLENILTQNKDLKDSFMGNIRNAHKWETDCRQDMNCSYQHNLEEYVNSSVAERTERHLTVALIPGVLINFSGSVFGEAANIDITKTPGGIVDIECALDDESIDKWLIAKGLVNPLLDYSTNSKKPPRDYHTILTRNAAFVATNRYNQGRKLYQRTGYNELWVVDNFHIGTDAHVEVFDSTTGKHMGTSPINAINIRTKFRDKDKHITP